MSRRQAEWAGKCSQITCIFFIGPRQPEVWYKTNRSSPRYLALFLISGPEQVLDVDLLSGYSSAKFSFAIKVFISITFDKHGHSDQDLWSQLHAGESFDYAWTVQLKNGAGDLSYLHLLDRFSWLPTYKLQIFANKHSPQGALVVGKVGETSPLLSISHSLTASKRFSHYNIQCIMLVCWA